MSHHHHSPSPFPSCFRPSTTTDIHQLPPPPPPPPNSGNSNLTTCLYQTDLGLFSLTWSRTFLGHSLHLHLHPIDYNDSTPCSPISLLNPLSLSTISFHLNVKPFVFWKKHGSKKVFVANPQANSPTPRIQIFWDLSRARFGSGPEPQSGFHIAVVVEREMVLLVGDLTKEAFAKTKALKQERPQVLVLRREHVFGSRVYTTRARFGGKNREISIDCSVNNDARLCFSVDNQRVLQIKRLKWKFRGNERIEVDGVHIQVSWDVYNWLFDDINNDHAVFMFRFESVDPREEEQVVVQNQKAAERRRGGNSDDQREEINEKNNNNVAVWQQNSSSSSSTSLGMSPVEWRKMRKNLMRTAARSSSSSSISMSSASSGCSSSVMEWASSTEESELCGGPIGFSLLVYAWRK